MHLDSKTIIRIPKQYQRFILWLCFYILFFGWTSYVTPIHLFETAALLHIWPHFRPFSYYNLFFCKIFSWVFYEVWKKNWINHVFPFIKFAIKFFLWWINISRSELDKMSLFSFFPFFLNLSISLSLFPLFCLFI